VDNDVRHRQGKLPYAGARACDGHDGLRARVPKSASPVCQQGANIIALELLSILLVKDSKFQAIKASQSFLCADPYVAVSGLCY
jgi:hypothetical protein